MTRSSSVRGVSEVVSFVLVFGLVISTVGIVYVSGFGGIERVQGVERVSNAERAFDVLGDNLADIYSEGAPSRATEIKLSDADLAIGTASTVRVDVTNLAGTNVYGKNVDPIVYSAPGSDTQIVYEAGAVIRTDGSNGIMLREPPFRFSKNGATRRMVVPIVQTRSVGVESVGGSTTVLVRGERSVSQPLAVERDPGTVYEVDLEFDTTLPRASVWVEYFEAQITWADDPCTNNDGTVTCSVSVDELYVTWTGINVQIQQ